jgi:hypothetical protein
LGIPCRDGFGQARHQLAEVRAPIALEQLTILRHPDLPQALWCNALLGRQPCTN